MMFNPMLVAAELAFLQHPPERHDLSAKQAVHGTLTYFASYATVGLTSQYNSNLIARHFGKILRGFLGALP